MTRRLLVLAFLAVLSGHVNARRPLAFSAVGLKVNNALGVEGIREGECISSDCEVLRKDGSRWTMNGDIVFKQSYVRADDPRNLPFNLFRIKTKDRALKKIKAATGMKLGRTSTFRYEGQLNHRDGTYDWIYVEFSKSGLVKEIAYLVGPLESD